MADEPTARAAILQVATRLFAAHGFEPVTVRQIATGAQVSPGLVIHHFGSKQGLQEAVVARVEEWMDGAFELSESSLAAEALETHNWNAILEEAGAFFDDENVLPDLVTRLVADRDPAAGRLMQRLVDRTEQVLALYVERGILVDDPDPRTRAAMLVATDLGAMMLRRQVASVLDFDPYHGDGMMRWAELGGRVYASLFVAPPDPTTSPDHREN